MRIRTIKPEFFLHDGLFEAEKTAKLPLRLAFIGLWCAADREGRFKWEPRRLGVSILPYDSVDFSRVLDALLTRGFLVKYRVGDDWIGAIPGFLKHQIVNNRETPSSLPSIADAEEVSNENHASATRGAREGHAPSGEGKGREGKGKEGEGASLPALPDSLNTPEMQSAWSDWLAFRSAKKKPVTVKSAEQAMRDFLRWGIDGAIRSIRESIRNDWQGLFEPKGPAGKQPAPRNLELINEP